MLNLKFRHTHTQNKETQGIKTVFLDVNTYITHICIWNIYIYIWKIYIYYLYSSCIVSVILNRILFFQKVPEP